MNSISKYAISEVYEILMHMKEEERKKIPEKAMTFLKENRFSDYASVLDFSKSLVEQKLNSDTLALLTVFYIMGLCDSETEKQQVLQILKNNERRGEK